MNELESRDLVQLLIEEPCTTKRSRAHLELGRRNLSADPGRARAHFREAVALDPTDERPRAELEQLGATEPPAPPRRGVISRLLRRG